MSDDEDDIMSDDEFDARWGEALRAAERWREAALYAELEEIGYHTGQERMRRGGDSVMEAIWHTIPKHCRVGSHTWTAFGRGVRRAYGLPPDWMPDDHPEAKR